MFDKQVLQAGIRRQLWGVEAAVTVKYCRITTVELEIGSMHQKDWNLRTDNDESNENG